MPRAIARVLIMIAAVSITAEAGAFCTKPDAPYCAASFGAFDDRSDFESCRSEMESYKSNVEEFLSCQKRESDSAVSDYNDAVESFNRRARG